MKSDSKKIKVMTIFGTRPEIIRLSRVLARLDKYVNHITVYTGQSYDYEMSKIFFEELGVRKPDYFLEVKSDTLGGQIAKIIERSEEALQKEKPDALLVLGDTNSALSAIIAKRLKIPIVHMEAGNRCFDENVPEEINRRIVDHISDLNLPYSENARFYLTQEGIHPGGINVTGSPMNEVISFYRGKIDKSQILKKLKLQKGKYFTASIHREENVDSRESLEKLIGSLNAIAEMHRMPILMSTHPRTARRLEEYKIKAHGLVNFHKPMGYFDYVNLQANSFCVISDSGTILEESSILGFPAVQVRASSERPEAYDEGAAILTGLDKDIILESIDVVVSEKREGVDFNIPRDYQDTNVSSKVLRHILSLVGTRRSRK